VSKFTVGMRHVSPCRPRAVDDEQHVHRRPAVKSSFSCLEQVQEEQQQPPVNTTINFSETPKLFRNDKTLPKYLIKLFRDPPILFRNTPQTFPRPLPNLSETPQNFSETPQNFSETSPKLFRSVFVLFSYVFHGDAKPITHLFSSLLLLASSLLRLRLDVRLLLLRLRLHVNRRKPSLHRK
jgi:hypothetical protein